MSASKRHSGTEATDQGVDLPGVGFAVAFSSGIRKIRHIHNFLRVEGVVSPFEAARRRLPVSCVVVWGRKQKSRRALQYAERRALPVLYVEDGWIRTCSANAHSRISYSLLVDDVGVYYDSTVPSALELFLNLPDEQFDRDCGAGNLSYAAQCRQLMIDNDITKYNYCAKPQDSELNVDDRALVLVLDQTRDDASVRLGGMNADAFNALLDRAVGENPDSRVIVRTHPDVVAGRRKGYLQDRAQTLGIEISANADNPIPWLKRASIVYVGTSQLGYEALLCGCSVKVGGQPFYAGWGLTEDFQPIERRVRQRSLDQLFHATHVHHARYCCPVTGRHWELHECLEHVKLQQLYFRRNAVQHVCVGITPWKRKYMAQFLRSPYGNLRFSAKNNAGLDETPVYWSFTDKAYQSAEEIHSPDVASHHKQGLTRLLRVEDGFIRSKGLGSDFVLPASMVFDEVGLYFDGTTPSALEQLLNTYQCSDDELVRARELRSLITASNLTKYNVDTLNNKPEDVVLHDPGQKSILVVGQVEGDQSILRGSPTIRSNAELLTAVREQNPDAYILYKPHPDVVSGNRKGDVDSKTLKLNANDVEIHRNYLACLDGCSELHTMTSLSGFEAILRGKEVVTYGLPFYAGWGLTRDMQKCHRRSGELTVDELVYICIVLYPHYVDLSCGEFITVEQLIKKLSAERSVSPDSDNLRWMKKVGNIYEALTYRG